METVKFNGLDPQAYPADIFERKIIIRSTAGKALNSRRESYRPWLLHGTPVVKIRNVMRATDRQKAPAGKTTGAFRCCRAKAVGPEGPMP